MTERSAVDGMAPCAFVVVGANHRSSSPGLRDRIFVDDSEIRTLLTGLRDKGVPQCLVMSTCDRVEVQAAAPDPEAAGTAIRKVLARRDADREAAESAFYLLTGDAAVRHVFAVASSLDSVVVGEAQVLGQLKQAHRDASAAGCVGGELEALLQAAYAAAKEARSATGIAEGPVSMASAAVRVARDLHGDIADTQGLLIGGGDMGLLMLEQFRHAGMTELTVAASSRALADRLARGTGGHAATFETLDDCLAQADIVIGASGLGRHLVTADMVRTALRRRRHRPIFAIDAAVPGDIEPGIDRLADAFRYDLDDLEEFTERNRAQRSAAAEAAWAIVDRHAEAFGRARASRQAVPTVAGLHRRFERLRQEILAEGAGETAEELTRRLVARLLHDPAEILRSRAAGGADDTYAAAARALFRLDVEAEAGTRAGAPQDRDNGPEGNRKDKS